MRTTRTALLAFAMGAVAMTAGAHCQIPCGIYDDHMRIDMILEHATTIEKSMNQIVAVQKETPVNFNQLVRWVDNKEVHAEEIQDIVTDYFLTQRVTRPAAMEGEAWTAYVEQLATLHGMLVAAMKAKQTTDLEHVQTLRRLAEEYREAFLPDRESHHHPPGGEGRP
jgi:nickel superoxide dismutase